MIFQVGIQKIFDAVFDGFDKQLVDKKITTLRKFKHIKETTTLSALDKNVIYKNFTYNLWTHNKFNKIFKYHYTVFIQQNK